MKSVVEMSMNFSKMKEHGIQCIHVIKLIVQEVANATIVQNDVVMGLCIKSMNMVNDSQCECVIMQLMLGNVINMYEESIKKDHNKFAKEMHKLIYHG